MTNTPVMNPVSLSSIYSTSTISIYATPSVFGVVSRLVYPFPLKFFVK